MEMKCPNCGGKGKYKNVFGKVDGCYYCLGTGKVNDKGEQVRTNEEWFDSLPTKEKAEWLDKVAENCCQICDEENRELCRGNIAIGCKFENAEKWELWLKQPHTEKE